MPKIIIAKVEYEYETSIDNKTIYITREDGATATAHDDLNHVGDSNYYDDWEDWIQENIDYIKFFGGEE